MTPSVSSDEAEWGRSLIVGLRNQLDSAAIDRALASSLLGDFKD